MLIEFTIMAGILLLACCGYW